GYAEAAAALRGPDFGHPDYRARVREKAAAPSAMEHFQSRSLLSSNPPDHTRLRRVVNAVLTPAVTEAARAQTQVATDRLLDRVEAAGRMDVVEDLAFPLAVGTIAHLLGVPEGDVHRLRERIRTFTGTMAVLAPSRDHRERGNAAMQWLADYFRR